MTDIINAVGGKLAFSGSISRAHVLVASKLVEHCRYVRLEFSKLFLRLGNEEVQNCSWDS